MAAARPRKANRVNKTSGQLDVASLEKAIDQMDDKMLICRDLGHHFINYKASLIDRRTYEQTMRCSRGCGATVTRHVDTEGYIVTRKTNYTDKSYLLTGFGRATRPVRAQMRLHSILRTIR